MLLKRRSIKLEGRYVRVELGCTQGGENKRTATNIRRASQINTCPFLLVGTSDKSGDWELEVVNDTHNHKPARNLEAHAFARRLTSEAYDMVKILHDQGLDPCNIFSAIKRLYPQTSYTKKDIYNAIDMINRVA